MPQITQEQEQLFNQWKDAYKQYNDTHVSSRSNTGLNIACSTAGVLGTAAAVGGVALTNLWNPVGWLSGTGAVVLAVGGGIVLVGAAVSRIAVGQRREHTAKGENTSFNTMKRIEGETPKNLAYENENLFYDHFNSLLRIAKTSQLQVDWDLLHFQLELQNILDNNNKVEKFKQDNLDDFKGHPRPKVLNDFLQNVGEETVAGTGGNTAAATLIPVYGARELRLGPHTDKLEQQRLQQQQEAQENGRG